MTTEIKFLAKAVAKIAPDHIIIATHISQFLLNLSVAIPANKLAMIKGVSIIGPLRVP